MRQRHFADKSRYPVPGFKPPDPELAAGGLPTSECERGTSNALQRSDETTGNPGALGRLSREIDVFGVEVDLVTKLGTIDRQTTRTVSSPLDSISRG